MYAQSIAVQLILVVPTGNIRPDVSLQDKLMIPEASVAVASKLTIAPERDVGSTLVESGHVMVGGYKS